MFRNEQHLNRSNRMIFVWCLFLLVFSSSIFAGGKIGIYAIHMVPRGDDAENYSRPGFGGGFHIVAPLPKPFHIFAGTGGFEIINLLNETTKFRDQLTRLRLEQETSQNYLRFFIGGQVGGHGRGFIRPHAGLNLAFVVYSIGTDVVIPDDNDRENEIRQDLEDETHTVFGSDITLGIDLNFNNKWNLDGGVRYLKSFSLPQQLGEGSEKIHPEYFQIYLSLGISFKTIMRSNE